MNDHDAGNLRFLLSADEQTLTDWYDSASEDDILYARDLLAVAHLNLIDRVVDNMTEFSDTTAIMQRFIK
jgi:hypothetical protein